MSKCVTVAKASELKPGQKTMADTGLDQVVVCNVEGKYFAVDAVCPHAGGPLGQGILQGNILTCPLHGWRFDVRTGSMTLSGGSITIPTYPVVVKEDQVQVEVSE